jgi:hypothetical protein
MSRILFIIICLFTVGTNESQAQLIIDSVSFVVQTGGKVTVTNDITSAKGLPSTGKYLLQGTDSQSINMNGKTISNLEIDNVNNVWLQSDLTLTGSLKFSNGKFITDGHSFTLSDIAQASGMADNKFIETNNSGQVIKQIAVNLSSYEIPVGAGSLYRPVFLTTSGSNNGAKVGMQLHNIACSNKPPSTSDYLKSNWTITSNGINGTLSARAKYAETADVFGNEDNLKAYIFDGTDWSSSGTIDKVANTISFSITNTSVNITAIDKFSLLKAKVLLQGPYNTATHLMSDNLRAAGVIPLTDPYSEPPYNTAFVRINDPVTEAADATVFNAQPLQSDNIIDWIFLELRNTAAGDNIVQTRSALVQCDGDIVDVDGKSPVTFNNIADGNYTVAVRHRNHLGISTDPATLTPLLTEKQSVTSFVDFTASSFLFGGNNAHGVASDGKYILWGGDANINGIVRFAGLNNDKDFIYVNSLNSDASATLSAVYSPADVNMDSKIKFNALANDKYFIYTKVLENSSTIVRTESLP